MFLIGIDGGGTSCRAALATADGVVIGRGVAGSANVRTDLQGTRAAIIEAVAAAFIQAGVDGYRMREACSVLGLAGANVGTYAADLSAILPFRANRVETDALIALEGAVGPGDGAMAILGTGTAYLARHGGALHSVGGWGFLVGDQGSGSRIGRDLLEGTLLAHDGVVERTLLTQALLEQYEGNPALIVEFTRTATPGDFARLAPMVFDYAERGDPAALQIIERARAAIEASLRTLPLTEGAPLCLLGGIAPLMQPRLSQHYRDLVRPPLTDALGGAVSMAHRLYVGRET